MKLYIINNREMPWGDYGDLLLSGMSNLDENDEKIIERTGPYLPPMYISGLWDLIVSNEVKNQLLNSGFTGFEIESVKKGKIVEIHWDEWSFESDAPEFYPLSGEAEDYIFDGKHSDIVSNLIGNLWIMKLSKSGHFIDEKLILSEYYDFFMPEDRGIIIVTDTAKQWLENNSISEWIIFEELTYFIE